VFTHLSRLFKHSVVYGLSETISRGTGFVLLFIYIIVLSKSEIGIRTALYAASAFLTLFYTLGLDNAFLRYFMDNDYRNDKDIILSTSLYFTALTGFLFFIITLCAGESISRLITESSSYVYITRLLFIIIILDTIVIYPTLILRAENRFIYYLLISLSRFFLFVFFNLLLVWYWDRGLKGVFEANLIVVLIVFSFLLPVYRKYFSGKISFEILKKMLLFGVPTIFTILALRIIDLADRRIILHFLGESQLGQYAVPYTLGMVGIMVFVNSFRIAWQPFFLSISSKPEAKSVFSRTATYYAVFISLVFMVMVLFRNEIFSLYDMTDKFPVSLSNIIPYIAFSYIMYGFYVIMLAGVFIKKRTIFLPLAALTGAVLNVGLNFIFIPEFGIIGAAYTTIIAYTVMVIFLYFISRYIYLVNYEFKRLGAVFIFTAVPISMSFFYQPDDMISRFFFKCMLCLIPLIMYYLGGFLYQEEHIYIKQLIKKYFSKT
jgi:O-antigen/teichoic acid export membrane protein